jgi:hypothetical protein
MSALPEFDDISMPTGTIKGPSAWYGPDHFIPHNGSITPGDPGQGGIRTPGQVLNAPLEAV